ncbi:MAG: low molecular weight phosphotyrosine protein phosphatase [Clostridia bacterium]|nr:low molecular weight phosphotyrosine protein phosphatase [Clostridia bacterium]
MAEFIAADMIKKRGLEREISVYSSALSDEEHGNPVYPPALQELKKHGVPTYPHYANLVTMSQYDDYDLFVCMEGHQIARLKSRFAGDKDDKVRLLLNYAKWREGDDIADPWYTGNFKSTYEDLVEGITALLDALEKDND